MNLSGFFIFFKDSISFIIELKYLRIWLSLVALYKMFQAYPAGAVMWVSDIWFMFGNSFASFTN